LFFYVVLYVLVISPGFGRRQKKKTWTKLLRLRSSRYRQTPLHAISE